MLTRLNLENGTSYFIKNNLPFLFVIAHVGF